MTNQIVSIREVSTEIDYWFFRTDSGDNFETYLENDFIAIGWNYITLEDLNRLSESQIKAKIFNHLDNYRTSSNEKLTDKAKRTKASDAFNKMVKFRRLRTNDIIVIPSESSNMLAFGKIVDNITYSEKSGKFDCDYNKRRKIQWLTEALPIDSLDPIFYKIRKTQHTITKIEERNQYYIDSILYNVYEKAGNSHFVIKINTTDPINLLSLSKLLKDMHDLMQLVNEELGLNENIDASSIRLNLQSPGLLNLMSGKALLFTAFLIGAAGCNMNKLKPEEKTKLEKLQQQNETTLNKVISNLDTLNAGY